jgi:hypothetical protein
MSGMMSQRMEIPIELDHFRARLAATVQAASDSERGSGGLEQGDSGIDWRQCGVNTARRDIRSGVCRTTSPDFEQEENKDHVYFSKTTGKAHFVPPGDNRWAIRADRCKPNEAVPIVSYRSERSLVSGGNERSYRSILPSLFNMERSSSLKKITE